MDQSIEKGRDAPSLPSLPRLCWDIPVFIRGRLSGVKRRARWVLDARPKTEYLVLVVNDIPDIVILLEAWLKQGGYRVARAYDGIQAVDAARALRPDLILLNEMMPRLDGLGALARLRADPATAGIKVIMHSAHPMREVAYDAGAQDFLEVPFVFKELDGMIKRVLGS